MFVTGARAEQMSQNGPEEQGSRQLWHRVLVESVMRVKSVITIGAVGKNRTENRSPRRIQCPPPAVVGVKELEDPVDVSLGW